jgi:hypothetical protein
MSSNFFDQLTAAPASADDQPESGLPVTAAGIFSESGAAQADADAETERTPARLRDVTQNLLASGLIEQTDKPNLYRLGLTHLPDLNSILEPLDLHVGADEVRGLLFLLVRKEGLVDDDEWAHPLVRKQRLTLEQSLLVAILRQHFVSHEQEHGVGAGDAVVNVDELSSHLQLYLGDPGSEAKERNRTLQLIEQLKGHGLVTAPDSHDRVGIRPLIAHLANPENLQALLRDLQQLAADASAASGEDD